MTIGFCQGRQTIETEDAARVAKETASGALPKPVNKIKKHALPQEATGSHIQECGEQDRTGARSWVIPRLGAKNGGTSRNPWKNVHHGIGHRVLG